ncbi:hypothetical protein [Christiangramia sp. SM2212]|uniref:Uncharacterized protein n=1 Tax=Christiangramia sediminicola TaxID=3073267 RepID=A0ABU1EU17_9FLAO|nr:hypothetical protein [Christiangramia sp. SM2212]MDR5591895.1 hypothetical protein [Christiangramia sp. SM2212]
MKYYSMNEFLNKIEVSRSTVSRFYSKYTQKADERKPSGKRLLIPETHIKYFNFDLMLEDEARINKRMRNMEKLLDCIRHKEDMPTFLFQMEWNIFGTISYRDELSSKSSYNRMQKIWNKIETKYKVNNSLRMYFTTEHYGIRDGHHNHFVIYSENKKYLEDINLMIKNMNKFDRVDLEEYDPYDSGIYYISKDGNKGERWDIFMS